MQELGHETAIVAVVLVKVMRSPAEDDLVHAWDAGRAQGFADPWIRDALPDGRNGAFIHVFFELDGDGSPFFWCETQDMWRDRSHDGSFHAYPTILVKRDAGKVEGLAFWCDDVIDECRDATVWATSHVLDGARIQNNLLERRRDGMRNGLLFLGEFWFHDKSPYPSFLISGSAAFPVRGSGALCRHA